MPYLEILALPPALPASGAAPDAAAVAWQTDPLQSRAAIVHAITDAMVEIFSVTPDIVTLFFVSLSGNDYAHAGRLANEIPAGHVDRQRVWVKVHAYRRDTDRRRALAARLTPLLARHYRAPEASVAVYFCDRAPDEVAHNGTLSSDV